MARSLRSFSKFFSFFLISHTNTHHLLIIPPFFLSFCLARLHLPFVFFYVHFLFLLLYANARAHNLALTAVCNSSQPTSVVFALMSIQSERTKYSNSKNKEKSTIDTGTPHYKHRSIAFFHNWGDNMLVIKSIMKCSVCGNCLDDGFSFFILDSFIADASLSILLHLYALYAL